MSCVQNNATKSSSVLYLGHTCLFIVTSSALTRSSDGRKAHKNEVWRKQRQANSLFSTANGSSVRSGICCCLCQLLGNQKTTAQSLFKEALTLSFSASSLPSSPFLFLILHNISLPHPTLTSKNVQQNSRTTQASATPHT